MNGTLTPVENAGRLTDLDRMWTVVVVGDGYTATELPEFRKQTQLLAGTMRQTAALAAFAEVTNLLRLEWPSAASSAAQDLTSSNPKFSGNLGAFLYASKDPDRVPIARSMWGDTDKLIAELESHAELTGRRYFPIVLVNNAIEYGASAGKGYTANGREVDVVWMTAIGDWAGAAIHELGHSRFDLDDEYEQEPKAEQYTGSPIDRKNVSSRSTVADLKLSTNPGTAAWGQMISPIMPIPSSAPRSSALLKPWDEQALASGVQRRSGQAGIFEGAWHYPRGMYRSGDVCRMRHSIEDFCPLCQWQIRTQLGAAWTPHELSIATGGSIPSKTSTIFTHAQAFPMGGEAWFLLYALDGTYEVYSASKLRDAPPAPNLAGSNAAIDGGWSWLLPFVRGGEVFFHATEFVFGRRAIYKLVSSTAGVALDLQWDSGAQVGPPWSSVSTFVHGGVPHVLSYSRFGGAALLERLDSTSSAPTVVSDWRSQGMWSLGWSHVAAFEQHGTPHVVRFASAAPAAGPVDIQPLSLSGARPADNPKGSTFWGLFSHVVPYTRSTSGDAWIIRYSAMNGLALLDAVRRSGQGSDTVTRVNLPLGGLTALGGGAPVLSAFEFPDKPGRPAFLLLSGAGQPRVSIFVTP